MLVFQKIWASKRKERKLISRHFEEAWKENAAVVAATFTVKALSEAWNIESWTQLSTKEDLSLDKTVELFCPSGWHPEQCSASVLSVHKSKGLLLALMCVKIPNFTADNSQYHLQKIAFFHSLENWKTLRIFQKKFVLLLDQREVVPIFFSYLKLLQIMPTIFYFNSTERKRFNSLCICEHFLLCQDKNLT